MVILWQYFLEDNLDAFRQLLADATFNVGSQRGPGSHGAHKSGNPALPSTSPRGTFVKNRKSLENTKKATRTSAGQDQRVPQINLTRADVNARDTFGRTLLHHVASSSSDKALAFMQVLLQIPFLDLYVQDLESGWTPLHRALYHGHVSIAQALMLRDMSDMTDYTTSVLHHVSGGLIKIKDHEGNSPFEVFSLTIASRDLRHSSLAIPTLGAEDTTSVHSTEADGCEDIERSSRRLLSPRVNLLGDEVFAFGSNKNMNLGLGDGDDRQFPEQVTFDRPEQLLHRLHADAQAKRSKVFGTCDFSSTRDGNDLGSGVPAVVRHQRLVIQDLVMSKLHTAVITNDPESNVYVCGFGSGGRLGTGDESTRFSFVCLETGALSKKHVVVIALGQDHSIAVCEQGEVYTWGSNKYGQLGYSLPQSASTTKDNPMQLVPRQLFGTMKKEMVIGAAASSLHSVIFTMNALYTFGKNEGQLGLMDADARSLEMQLIPRRVGVSILQSPILMVSAIDRATTILLESHEVIVLTHYGWTKVSFQLEGFTNGSLLESSATRYDSTGNFISKITSGGSAICAMSTFGEVFTIDVSKKPDPLATNQSTTNPSKARNALPQPSKLWSIGKSHMAASDVAVGQDGSIILCTISGSVWRKEKRAKIKEASTKGKFVRVKDYKFARIPNINRAVAVRSNAYGAYTAIRKDYDVARQQIIVDRQSIWDDFFIMLPFRELAESTDEDSDTENPRPRFWTPATSALSPVHIKQAILLSADIESRMDEVMQAHQPLSRSQYDLWIGTSMSEVRIPAHSFLVKARSSVLRHALAEFRKSYYFSIPDVLCIQYGTDGHIYLQFQGADFLTVLNYVFYLYTENIVDVWHHTQRKLHLASRYRQIRTELMKIGSNLDMEHLERAARVMTEPARCLHLDMEMGFRDSDFFTDADVWIELADDCGAPAHSALLSRRCPFFEGLFMGRAGGLWVNSRRDKTEAISEVVRVDLKHIRQSIFGMALRHIYADTREEIFEDVVTADLDEFIDVIIEVMGVSNELMLDRLTQVCQKMLGQYVTTRNVCQLLNAVAPCSVNEFKIAGLEYICLNLETMLEHRLLEELDDDLLVELDEMVQENQLAFLPFARSGRAEALLFDQYPELVANVEQGRQKTLDSLRLHSRMLENEERIQSAQRARADGSEPAIFASPSASSKQSATGDRHAAVTSPASISERPGSDMLFEMDEEHLMDNLHNSSYASREQSRDTDIGFIQGDRSTSSHPRPGLQQPSHSPHFKSEGPVVGSTGSSFKRGPSSNSAFWEDSGADLGSPGGVGIHGRTWQSPVAGSPKVDLKGIMAQASASGTSNLTLALGQRDAQLLKAPQRLSQRERKKIQHQQSQDKVGIPAREVVATSKSSMRPQTPKSPWQTMSKEPKPSLSSTKSADISVSPQSSSRPAMTMRQTMAGGSSSVKETIPAKLRRQPRSVSSPGIVASSKPTPSIHSICHTPTTPTISNSPSANYHSLADIVAQQLGEKSAIKEAAAKRPLQEIQQEQEFQEWWENESRKVQEKEQASAAAAVAAEASSATTRGTRGKRGGGHGKSSGRGGREVHANESSPRAVSADDSSRAVADSTRPSAGRGRGREGLRRGR